MKKHQLTVKKSCVPLSFLLATLLLFTGCSNLPDDVSQTGNSGNTSSDSSLVPSTSTSFTKPQKLQKTVSDKLSADATVEVPQTLSSGYADILNVKLMKFDSSIKNVFLKSNEKLKTHDDRMVDYFGKKINYYQDITQDNVILCTQMETGITYRKPFAGNLEQLLVADVTSPNRNVDKFSTTSELPFESRKKAYGKIEAKLALLGISVSPEYTCYSLDHKTMQEEERKFEKFLATLSPKMQKNANYKSIGNWTEQHDSYCFLLTSTINGMIVSSEDHGNVSGGTVVMGSTIKVFYDKDGIVELNVNDIYTIDSVRQAHQKLITAESALGKLADYYKDVISSDKFTVVNIQLEYIPTVVSKDRTNFVMVPAWRFDLKLAGSNSSATNKMFVNAVTGEIIK